MSAPAASLRILIIHASHHLTNHAASGDGLVAWGYIAELARMGHRIHAVTDKLDVTGDVPPNLTLIEFPRRSTSPIVHYVRYMAMVRALYKRIATTEGVDVVHQMNPVVRGLSLALVGCKVPIVLGTYVGDWKWLRSAPTYRPRTIGERIAGFLKAILDAWQQHHAAALALATPNALSRVPLRSGRANRIAFLHHGVDTALFTPQPQANDPERRPFAILFVGSVRYYKGVATLVDAFKRVVLQIPEAKLVFVGSGLNAEMAQRLGDGLAKRAEFAGPSSRSEVAGWLRACSVLCAPSFGEPYGQNVLEAMATGKPVVATSEGGHPYLVDAEGGYCVAPGDTDALASALIDVLRDPLRAERMGAHNRALIERRNAWPLVANDLERIYRGAIAPSSPG
ncbi:MAG: glycosyltransferase family 4 protein [Candidatus Eremiobacteraeota bacterium]|nr:glycosyltransferase family 4 protein [Candidatus Eremiobacteraeota bacterium]